MATLFEETTIKGMTLRNRMVRSATWEGMCDEKGRPTEKLKRVLLRPCKGRGGPYSYWLCLCKHRGEAVAGADGKSIATTLRKTIGGLQVPSTTPAAR